MEANLQQEERYRTLTTKPVSGIILKMAVPTILGMLVTAIYNMTDTYFVSLLHDVRKTAAVGVIFSFMAVVQACGFLFGHGSGNFMSRLLGKREEEKADEVAATGMVFSVITGIVLAVLGFLLWQPLIQLLGGNKTPELAMACKSYLLCLLPSLPAMTGALTLNNQLRLQGSAKDGMIGMMAGMILNMLLDPIFILEFHMGIAGAGIATTIGQYVTIAILLFMSKKNGNIQIKLQNFRMSREYVKEILGGGSPNFLRQSITSVAAILLNQAAGVYGEEALAAYTITNRITVIAFSVVIGFGQGFQPVCGFNYGAKLYDRVKKAFHFSIFAVTGFLVILTAIQYGKAEALMSIFSDNETVVLTGAKILRYQCISMIFLGYYTIAGMMLQNIGQFFKAAVVSAARQGIFFIPLILILPICFGFEGVILAQPIADILAFLMSLVMGIYVERKL